MASTEHRIRNLFVIILVTISLGCAHTPGSVPKKDLQDYPTELSSFPEPTSSEPVKAVMIVRPDHATAGSTTELLVYIRIAPAHFLHAPAESSGYASVVAMDAALPEGVEAAGDWIFPLPKKGHGDSLVYRDSLVLRRALHVSSRTAPQSLKLTGSLRFQACTDELCWPPGTIELSVPFVIQRKGS